jgi:hypothetical protein
MLVSNNYSSIKTNKNNQNNYFYFFINPIITFYIKTIHGLFIRLL